MFYRFWRTVIVGLAYALFGIQVRGRERLPSAGAYILAPSHRSLLDIPFAAAVTRRRLRYMAKQEIFNGRFWTWVFTELGAVAVDRAGTDRAALKAIEAALHGGEPVVIFPEGTRHEGPVLGPIASGTAYAALKAGVPVVPVGIGGSEHPVILYGFLPWWSRVTVVVGEPIAVAPHEGTVKRSAITALDAELRARLQVCFDDAEAWADARARRRGWRADRSGRAGEPGERG
ncbi:MAG: lysophospholipid acyltransferase family protein [Actinomycetota bacterium]